MKSNISLATSIQKSKRLVRNAILETVDTYKEHIVSESESFTADQFHFQFELRSNKFPTSISNVQLIIDIQDFPIDQMSYLKVMIHYKMSKNDWCTRIENRLFMRPSIKKSGKEYLLGFKRKVEKWV